MDAPIRMDMIRAAPIPVRTEGDDPGRPPRLYGHFSTSGDWYEVRSALEGHFMEMFRPGAFKKTFEERGESIPPIFHHGLDPSIGMKPIGKTVALSEDEVGARYEAELLQVGYVDDLIPGLRAGVYGSSFRFAAVRSRMVERPGKSAHNPEGIPEHTVVEAKVLEYGPTPIPVSPTATASVRSATDAFWVSRALAAEHDTGSLKQALRTVALEMSAPQARTASREHPVGTHPDARSRAETMARIRAAMECIHGR